jgi:cation diffusion facilitator CzcD-associated flavoprotein CzcO
VATNAGDYHGRRVVVATGFNRVPNVPRWPGQESFPGPIIHSSEYTNAEPFRGSRVLVVGFGNSGAEIALDLAEHGVHCAVAVRGKVNVIPRELFGIPIVVFSLALRPLPTRVADRMTTLTRRLAIGNLADLGLSKRDDGPLTEVAEGRQIPMIDVGTLARIRSGDIAVRKGVESFDVSDVRFADGTREHFDTEAHHFYTAEGAARLRAALDRFRGGRIVIGRGPRFRSLLLRLIASTGMLRQIGIEALARRTRVILREAARSARRRRIAGVIAGVERVTETFQD